MTGTQDWNKVLTDTLRSLSQMLISLGIKSLAGTDGEGFFSFLGGSLNMSPKPRANGGPVTGGAPYLVGEKGPELFVPNSNGNIVPNNAMGGGSGEVNSVVNITISDSGASVDKKQASEFGRMIETSVMGVINRERRPGGALYR